MLVKNLTKKLVVIALIFTLTFANFAVVTKTYAVGIFEKLFTIAGSTGSKDVEFDAYFKAGDEKLESLEADVNDENLKLYFDLNLLDEGYIKNSKISIVQEEGKTLNFKIADEFENELVEGFEDNQFAIVKIEEESTNVLEIPIEYVSEEFISLDKLSGDFKIVFEGVYVDEKAKEKELSKEISLNLSWKDNKEFNIQSEVTKFFQYESEGEEYSLLQTLIKIDTTTQNNVLPVKSIETKVELPTVGEGEIVGLAAIATSTMATNNKANDEVVFGEENLYFDEENDILIIKTENQIQTVVEESQDVLKEEEQLEEEKYFSGTGVDEYLVTYKIKNLDIEEEIDLISNITVKITSYAGIGNEDSKTTEVEKGLEAIYTISEATGENVSFKIENETEKLSKGYMYFNYTDSDKKYELEYKTKSIFNISTPELIDELKIEDVETYYLGKDESKKEETNTYYKKISILKDNFENILGRNGKIEILDEQENLLGVIKNNIEIEENFEEVDDTTREVEDTTEDVEDTTEEVEDTTGKVENSDENEDYFEVVFEEKISKLILKISDPIEEGNLIINEVKAQTETSLDKKEYSEVASINEVKKVTAQYKEIEETVDVAECISETILEDTTTKANLVLSTDKLSTLVENKDVEIKIELNNQKITSDMYGNSVFEIEFPEYVRNLEVTNSSIIYGEGLEISNVELLENNGRIYARVFVEGMQRKLSSGILTNGTNIILDANIIVDAFAPAKQDEIRLYYNNEESTNYTTELVENTQGNLSAVEVKTIEYSAPTGIVSVNSTSNYNEENTILTSINQGIKNDKLEILTNSRNAKMDLIVMNNSDEAISNIALLGRIPFVGIKDVISNDDLNTTVDSKLLSTIKQDERNEMAFKVYYSENGAATPELDLEENGWIENPENFDNIKSYLMVPENPEYVMENYKIMRFSYEYLIPENLEHNANICSAFATYYKNEEDLEQVSGADIVYLTTGEGPQFRIETTTNVEKIKEFEELTITTILENTAPIDAKNVVLTMPLPEGVKFIRSQGDFVSRIEENNVIFEIEKIEAGRLVELSTVVKIEEVKGNLKIRSEVSAKDLAKTIESEEIEVEVLEAEIKVSLLSDSTVKIFSDEGGANILTPGKEIRLNIEIENLTNKKIENVIAEMDLSKYFEFSKAKTLEMEDIYIKEVEVDCYDSENHSIKWKINTLDPHNKRTLNVYVKLKDLEDGLTKENIYSKVTAKADNIEEYTSSERVLIIGAAILEITQTTDMNDTYVNVGDYIRYNFEIKNVGTIIANKVNLSNKIPEGLVVKEVEYTIGGIKNVVKVSQKKEISIGGSISPGEKMTATVFAMADDIGQREELSVSNYAMAKGTNTEEVTSNTITHIIEPQIIYDEQGNIITENKKDNNNSEIIEKTYKITGVAWLDENEDGIRNPSEKRLSGITAKLVDSVTGIIKDRTTTNKNGEYTFKNVLNGSYIVIFDYDSDLYALTKYQVSTATTNANSDVTSTKVSQDGKQIMAAVTNTIIVNNGSVSNIDLGLITADSFDLKLDKTVTKITVQNAKGTDTVTFDNTKLAKTEIASKYINSSTAYIEYSIKVTNVGDLAGYAKKIVDYLPEETTFNSGLKGNEQWYSAEGKLYSAALADTLIAPGETKEIKLVLTKQMNEHSSSLMSNTAEIEEAYNVYGAKDKNSTAGNKIQNENDMSTADTIIGTKTGAVFVYTSVIITTMLLAGIVIFILSNKVVIVRRRGGA